LGYSRANAVKSSTVVMPLSIHGSSSMAPASTRTESLS
jgi:hypothetical protein